jgi:hypothetical protein
MNNSLLSNPEKIISAINQVIPDYDRVELRAVYPVTIDGKKRTDSGVFDRAHLTELATEAIRLNSSAAVYINLNPIKPEFVGPATNSIKAFAKGLFSNDDAAKRSLLLIDCDPIRPTNTSSSDAQLEAANKVAKSCAIYLESKGWGPAMLAMSGNGYHLLYRIDLDNTPQNTKLVNDVLTELGNKFNDDTVKIDTVVSNPGRIFKLYGTMANKGPNTEKTPHRIAELINVPEKMVIVSHEQLLKETPLGFLGKPPANTGELSEFQLHLLGNDFNLDKFMGDLGITYEVAKKGDGLISYKLDHCPFNHEHGKGDSAISKGADGKLGFHCFHNSCADKNWHSVRQLVEQRLLSTEHILEQPCNWQSPQKLPGELKPVAKLDPSDLPKAIGDAVIDIAERLSCPIDYLAIPALAGAGIAAGNMIGIQPKKFDDSWVVHPAFWGGIVGSPGSMKTPALQAALKPLQYLEEKAASDYKFEYSEYMKAKKVFDKEMSEFKSGKSTVFPVEPEKPIKKRLIVNDITYQALGEIISDNPQGVLALADELTGLLQSLDTPGQEAARGFYLSGWGGNTSYTFDRVTRGTITLNRFLLSVFGGFQPDRIKTYVRSAQSGSSKNDGLLQRFQLLVWPDLDDEYKYVDRLPDRVAIQAMEQAVIKLRRVATTPIPGLVPNRNGVQILNFDDNAQAVFNNWYSDNEKVLRQGKLDPSEHSHFAKYRSLIPGLALLFHLLDHDGHQVGVESLSAAIKFSEYLKSHAKRIYGSVHGLDATSARSLATNLIKGKLSDGFTQRTVMHKGWKSLQNKFQVEMAVNTLVEYGWLSEHASENAGRKTVVYRINPKISNDLL